jgi:hypothetical protein
MNATVRLALTVIVALFFVLAFAYLLGNAMLLTLGATAKLTDFSEPYIYVATVLAGLVGGVVAVAFGQKPPGKTTRGAQIAGGMERLGRAVLPSEPKEWQTIMAGLYAVIYVLWGAAALIVWFTKGNTITPELVRNFALIWLGLFVAVVRGFLGEN